MNEYYTLADKIKSLKSTFNVDFKDLRECNYQTNTSNIAYKDTINNYIYIYDCFINTWIEDKEDIFNYSMYDFEDKNYELINKQ